MVKLIVHGITGDYSSEQIKESILENTGADSVRVNADEKTVFVEGEAERGEVVHLLEELGYSVIG